MEENKIITFFAPAERATGDVIQEESKLFHDGGLFENLSEAVPTIFLILNEFRQIVFTNNRLPELLGLKSSECLLGKRPGEALNCAYATVNEGGCGTSEFCRECGAVRAILKAMKGITAIEECSLLTKNNDAINLKVWATPFTLGETKYTAFAVTDISSEKMYHNLQRTFFHDIVNVAGGISGLVELLSSPNTTATRQEYMQMLQESTKKLLAEIETQREMSKISQGEFNISLDSFSSLNLLKSLISLYQPHEVARGKSIIILPSVQDTTILTDQTLLLRVLGNMTKNALEASKSGDRVNLNCFEENNEFVFSVNNKNFMPKNVQLQVFKRSFSTKGKERGIGTYSMKLIGENFLKGKVHFESDEVNGTTFFISIPKSIAN